MPCRQAGFQAAAPECMCPALVLRGPDFSIAHTHFVASAPSFPAEPQAPAFEYLRQAFLFLLGIVINTWFSENKIKLLLSKVMASQISLPCFDGRISSWKSSWRAGVWRGCGTGWRLPHGTCQGPSSSPPSHGSCSSTFPRLPGHLTERGTCFSVPSAVPATALARTCCLSLQTLDHHRPTPGWVGLLMSATTHPPCISLLLFPFPLACEPCEACRVLH